jgi:hypothetical protein
LNLNPADEDMDVIGRAANLDGFHPVLPGDATHEGPGWLGTA